jgi:hypothetical protein
MYAQLTLDGMLHEPVINSPRCKFLSRNYFRSHYSYTLMDVLADQCEHSESGISRITYIFSSVVVKVEYRQGAYSVNQQEYNNYLAYRDDPDNNVPVAPCKLFKSRDGKNILLMQRVIPFDKIDSMNDFCADWMYHFSKPFDGWQVGMLGSRIVAYDYNFTTRDSFYKWLKGV